MERNRLLFPAYRVLAYVTGVLLILLAFVAMPAKYLFGADARLSLAEVPAAVEPLVGDDSALMLPIAMPHGYAYMAYVVVVLGLALSRRWGALRTVGVMVAGTIPVAGLVVERRLTRQERADARGEGSGTAAAVPDAASGG